MKKFYLLLLSVFLAQLLAAQVDCDGISGNITPGNATICQGESVLLTATGGSSYEWRLDDVVIDGQTGSTLTATQSGTYSVIMLRHTVGGDDAGKGLPVVNWSREHGDLRIAHFFGMHTLQIFPLFGYFIARSSKTVIAFALIYVGLVTAVLIQALMGLPLI